jgi:NAD(P)H-dependent flavin oxidoreductase YrpB (nitropropane dioxygenase family)
MQAPIGGAAGPRLAAAVSNAGGLDVIHFFWGDPSPYSAQMQAANAQMACTVADIGEAKQTLDAGAELLIAQGWEAGGHVRGQLRCEELVPAVVDVAGPVPVLAAGGIAHGKAMNAALEMGAAGVVGTLFVVA